jgi:hypothetical protein
MRKHLLWVLALSVALGSFVVASIASAVPNTQTISGYIKPTKLPGNKKAPITLFTDVAATNSGNPNQLPNPTTLSKVDYDKDGGWYQKGLPTCDPAQFTAATTTAQAKSACSDALIGSGSSKIAVPTGPSTPPLNVTAAVTAFAGKSSQCIAASPPPKLTAKQTKLGCIVLFSYNSLSGAQTLVGGIGPAESGSPPSGAGPFYGITLTVGVPPLAGGTAVITEFNTKVKKTYHFHGALHSVEVSRCGPDHKLHSQARFTDNLGQVAVGTFTQKCTVKG